MHNVSNWLSNTLNAVYYKINPPKSTLHQETDKLHGSQLLARMALNLKDEAIHMVNASSLPLKEKEDLLMPFNFTATSNPEKLREIIGAVQAKGKAIFDKDLQQTTPNLSLEILNKDINHLLAKSDQLLIKQEQIGDSVKALIDAAKKYSLAGDQVPLDHVPEGESDIDSGDEADIDTDSEDEVDKVDKGKNQIARGAEEPSFLEARLKDLGREDLAQAQGQYNAELFIFNESLEINDEILALPDFFTPEDVIPPRPVDDIQFDYTKFLENVDREDFKALDSEQVQHRAKKTCELIRRAFIAYGELSAELMNKMDEIERLAREL